MTCVMCPRCGCRETPAGLCSRCFLGRGCFDGISSRISLTLPGGEKFWHTSGLLCCPDDLHLRKPHLERKLGETLRDRPTIAHSQYLHSYLMKILSWWLGWFWYQIQGPWLQTHLCTPAIPRESCSRSRPQSPFLTLEWQCDLWKPSARPTAPAQRTGDISEGLTTGMKSWFPRKRKHWDLTAGDQSEITVLEGLPVQQGQPPALED